MENTDTMLLLCMTRPAYNILLYFISSPQEQKFRSKKELINHLNGVLDLSNFDFRSGEIKEKKKRPTKRSKLPDKQVLAYPSIVRLFSTCVRAQHMY